MNVTPKAAKNMRALFLIGPSGQNRKVSKTSHPCKISAAVAGFENWKKTFKFDVMRAVILLILTFVSVSLQARSELDSLLAVLDADIARCAEYDLVKEAKIEELKGGLASAVGYEERYDLNKSIFAEYMKYSSDSALCYINKNVVLARQNGDFLRETDALLEEANLFTCLGMYFEAKEILDGIDRASLVSPLLGKYYKYAKFLYYATSKSPPVNKITSSRYHKIAGAYSDSMMLVLPHTDDDYLRELMSLAKARKDYAEALRVNDVRISAASIGEPLYALVSYDSYQIYKSQGGHTEEALRCLILSAISDVRSAIKEQSAMLQLAKILYDKGDVDRANTYINYSWKVTEEYNTRMRNWNHISPYSVISTGFQNTINHQNALLRNLMILITLLSVALAVAFIYTYRLMKKLRTINGQLSESNKIKEVYIARFFKLCTKYIDRAQSYRNMVNKKLHKGEIEELLRITSPANYTSTEEQAELYAQFDKAFLNIFPNFVDSVNALLKPEGRIVLNEGEALTPELRVCALMRLGFLKPAQIAELLHYSPTTVYNYRTRLREKALLRDEFEDQITRISS